MPVQGCGAHDSSTLEFGVGLLFGVKSGVQRPRNEHRKSCHLWFTFFWVRLFCWNMSTSTILNRHRDLQHVEGDFAIQRAGNKKIRNHISHRAVPGGKRSLQNTECITHTWSIHPFQPRGAMILVSGPPQVTSTSTRPWTSARLVEICRANSKPQSWQIDGCHGCHQECPKTKAFNGEIMRNLKKSMNVRKYGHQTHQTDRSLKSPPLGCTAAGGRKKLIYQKLSESPSPQPWFHPLRPSERVDLVDDSGTGVVRYSDVRVVHLARYIQWTSILKQCRGRRLIDIIAYKALALAPFYRIDKDNGKSGHFHWHSIWQPNCLAWHRMWEYNQKNRKTDAKRLSSKLSFFCLLQSWLWAIFSAPSALGPPCDVVAASWRCPASPPATA